MRADRSKHGNLSHEPGHDCCLAGLLAGDDQTVRIDSRDDVEIGVEVRLSSHVSRRSVRVFGHDTELLLLIGSHQSLARNNADTDDARCIGCGRQGSGFDPVHKETVRFVVPVEALAAAVRDRAGRLLKHQAAVGRRRKHAATASLLHDRLIVERGIKTEERQLEPVLATGLSVTPAGVASVATQQGHDLRGEINRPPTLQPGDSDRDADFVFANRCCEEGVAITCRCHVAPLGNSGNVRCETAPLRLTRDVQSVESEQHLTPVERVGQVDRFRNNGQLSSLNRPC